MYSLLPEIEYIADRLPTILPGPLRPAVRESSVPFRRGDWETSAGPRFDTRFGQSFRLNAPGCGVAGRVYDDGGDNSGGKLQNVVTDSSAILSDARHDFGRVSASSADPALNPA
jgi:hypothetical protein